jgi:hypothetical protein
MATPSSGAIAFSDIAWIVSRSYSATTSLGDAEVRSLLGVGSGEIGMNSAYSKPTAGNTGTTYYAAGSYTYYVNAYQTLYADVAGGGGGGNGGSGSDTCTGWCGQFCFFPYCCNGRGGNGGGGGGESNFNGVRAYGGTGSTAGGNNQNGNTGGGGAGGSMGYAFGCSGGNGSAGQAGGRTQKSWTKGVDGPGYGAGLTVNVGGGGGGGYNAGGTGGTGWVYIAWS